MRKIKFRGFTKNCTTNHWEHGDIVRKKHGKHFIHFFDANGCECLYEVYPESVGQYTGLKDKNGKEIYEGDIVTSNWYDYDEPNHCITGEVVYSEGWLAFTIWDEENKVISEINGRGCYHWEIAVIGNIYENPELLGGGNNDQD